MDFLKKRRFKFEVELRVCHLSDVPLVNAVLFAKVRLLDCGNFEGSTDRGLVVGHAVQWTNRFEFTCRIGVDPSSGILERCMCRISIRKELKSGKGVQKLGFVDVNLSEFAASAPEGINRFYLLDGYGDSQRQDNSRLQISVKMRTQNATDPVFKVPARSGCSVDDVLLNPMERKAPSCNYTLKTIPLDDTHTALQEHPSPSHYDESNQAGPPFNAASEPPALSNFPNEMTSSTCSSTASTINNALGNAESPVSYVRVRSTPATTAPSSARRMSEERSRIQRTRIDAEHVIDEMLAEAEIEEPGSEDPEGGLALFIKDGGAAVLGSARYA